VEGWTVYGRDPADEQNMLYGVRISNGTSQPHSIGHDLSRRNASMPNRLRTLLDKLYPPGSVGDPRRWQYWMGMAAMLGGSLIAVCNPSSVLLVAVGVLLLMAGGFVAFN
jgi:hypothetical protein